MKLLLTLLVSIATLSLFAQSKEDLQGAWKTKKGTVTFSGDFFSYVEFDEGEAEFGGTRGGAWTLADGKIQLTYEFHTWESEKVGTTEEFSIKGKKNKLTMGLQKFSRIDNGTPGDLQGAWLITGRMRDGKISERTPGPRKTMKILSGKRFQWIAYNVETKEFKGTGGGSYTTVDGKYTENIEFFSRDKTRVGASLGFNYELKEGKWHHSGKSSKGKPIYEVWSRRAE